MTSWLYHHCVKCGKKTQHQVINTKGKGKEVPLEALRVQCYECGEYHRISIKGLFGEEK